MIEKKLEQFRRQYQLIREHRVQRDAPIDSMGTGALDYDKDPQVRCFQILVSTMLSSQTQDHQTAAAMGKLMDAGLSVEMVCATDVDVLGEMISTVRFANRKKGFLKKIAEILKTEHDGKVPRTEKEICKLPGVGPKMAIVVLEHGYGELVGIGIDTHAHRIANRLGWVTSEEGEETRRQLEAFLPKEEWHDLSVTLIGFGQQICKGKTPRCEVCNLTSECLLFAQNQVQTKG